MGMRLIYIFNIGNLAVIVAFFVVSLLSCGCPSVGISSEVLIGLCLFFLSWCCYMACTVIGLINWKEHKTNLSFSLFIILNGVLALCFTIIITYVLAEESFEDCKISMNEEFCKSRIKE